MMMMNSDEPSQADLFFSSMMELQATATPLSAPKTEAKVNNDGKENMESDSKIIPTENNTNLKPTVIESKSNDEIQIKPVTTNVQTVTVNNQTTISQIPVTSVLPIRTTMTSILPGTNVRKISSTPIRATGQSIIRITKPGGGISSPITIPSHLIQRAGLVKSASTGNVGQLIRTASGQTLRVISVPRPMTPSSNRPPIPGQTFYRPPTTTQAVIKQSLPGRSSSPVTVIRNGLPSQPRLPTSNLIPVTQATQKDVSRLWSNEDLKLKQFKQIGSSQIDEEVIIEEEDELGRAETYAEYMPEKVKIGLKHPDPVVETSSLSSVEPPNVNYKLSIPESVMDHGYLSALQLESIIYASQRHETILPSGERAGFLIGDGAGVGKGRTIAGIIYENYILGRKRAIWLSVSNDLRVDAERDLRDIGAGKIDVHALNKFKYAKISSKINNSVKKGVIFATYSSLIGESQSDKKYKTRLKQLLHWCGEDYDGCIIFDECHRAKNLCPAGSSKPTKTGLTVLELQNQLPKARVVYASATGASEPRNMAYMTRLGLWGKGTPFIEFNEFIQAVERRGVGAMELVAMDMKLRGMYIARQLSFRGVSFKIEEVPIRSDFVHIYNESVKLWVDARAKFQEAADLIDAEHRMRKNMWGQFWSAHQRFFKYLCISAKVRHCVNLAREAVKFGKCVVIGLQSTGEARTLEQLEEAGGELTDFVSTAKGVFQTLVEKHFPAPDRRKFRSLMGLGSGIFDDDSPSQSPKPGFKRKPERFEEDNYPPEKKMKESSSSSSSDESSSEDEEDSEPDSDFNPFGGSDSDEDDPWLKKKAKKQKLKAKSKKPKKEKKVKKEKRKHDDEDAKFDNALRAAGLMSKGHQSENDYSLSIPKKPLVDIGQSTSEPVSVDARDRAMTLKNQLLRQVEQIGKHLPSNTLDELIDLLGGPDNVAEMTGRKGRVVCNDDGEIQYESRSELDVPLEILNLTEKQRFMDGEKHIAIISEAASSGISLQADRRAYNQRRRVHITLELPWSADRAIQQFGRTHRSNQVSAPEYIFMISELAGERRFASTVSKRLESLGALTHGDRRATESRDLSQFNIDNKFGRTALENVMKSVIEIENPLVSLPTDYEGDFIKELREALIGVGMLASDANFIVPTLEKDYNNISKFLNRILGIKVYLQNQLFKFFSDTLAAVILQAKRDGKWDLGILDLGAGSENVKVLKRQVFIGHKSANGAKTELITVSVERGLSWEDVLDIWRDHTGKEDGFYVSTQMRARNTTCILAVAQSSSRKREKLYNVYRPNTGLQPRPESLESIKKKYKKVVADEAQYSWEQQFDSSAKHCSHMFLHGVCKRQTVGLSCEIGLRIRTYHILAGSVLSVWGKVENVLTSVPGASASRMQIVRLRTDDGKRIVGSIIPGNCYDAMCNVLKDWANNGTPTQVRSNSPFLKQHVVASRSDSPLLMTGGHSSTSSKYASFKSLDMPSFF
ncbi:protein strawberry notch homolog 1-like [Tubulanus polymorphus]|uniref:protein strawberry notch homolog 1-like n=1 Tax=Tubulanus polymorphus TaxID=672921 RepID=UPI003DA35FA1